MKKLLYAFTLALASLCLPAANNLFAQCGPGETHVRLVINSDYYSSEVSWQLTDFDNTVVYAFGSVPDSSTHIYNYCVPAGDCVVFRIHDVYGDGIAPDGYYQLYVSDSLWHTNDGGAYGFGENILFGCPPGKFCDNPLPLNMGQDATVAGQSESWYRFVPADTGTYQISTCGLGNTCPTKIWVYDHCQGITVFPNNLGTIFYAEGGCSPDDPNGAEATLYLASGQEYFVRIGYAAGNCGGNPAKFEAKYLGPVVGCTDPGACNYQPLATVSGPCIYPGDPNCTDLPDLVIREDVLKATFHPMLIPNADACAVQEGCIRGFGDRVVLNFTTHIQNIGVADYFIGSPPVDPNAASDQFVFDPCHNHWHYRGYAEYVLFDASGTKLPLGSKNGFCVLDLECSNGGLGKYNCSYMGITAGCGDIYDQSLPCQWIDITGIPPGLYTFVVRVNWDKSADATGRQEVTYDNNWAQACFTLDYTPDGLPIVEVVENCPQFADCAGTVFGDAQPDCKGVCNGLSLRGDYNDDTVRDTDDVEAYLAAALVANVSPTNCSDLDANASLDVYDAALLQECELHGDDVQYWGARFACAFPAGTFNEKDIVYLLPGAFNAQAKTLDVEVVNPYSKLLGFQFSVSGMVLDSVESLDPGFEADWQFNPANSSVVGLNTSEVPMKKHVLPANFLRLHYDHLTGDQQQVCLSGITAIVNDRYQRSNALIADPACVATGVTGTNDPLEAEALRAFVLPNPARSEFTIFFQNPHAEAYTVTLMDATGRAVRTFTGIREESVILQRDNMAAGLYGYKIEGNGKSVVGKVVLQ